MSGLAQAVWLAGAMFFFGVWFALEDKKQWWDPFVIVCWPLWMAWLSAEMTVDAVRRIAK